MSEFEEYIKARYPVDYESLQEKYPNFPVCEFYGDEQDLWDFKQAEIDQLKEALEIKEQLNEALRVAGMEKDKRIGEALEEIQRALNCCESTETTCVLGELVKVLRGEHE